MQGTLAGVLLALIATVLWSLSPLFFAAAGRRIGPEAVNLLRLLLATAGFFLLLLPYAVFIALLPGRSLPGAFSLSLPECSWLVLSGFLGLYLGDAFYLRALVSLGPHRTSQFLTLAPVASVALAWTLLDEALSARILFGIALVLGAVLGLVLAERHSDGKRPTRGAAPEAVGGGAVGPPLKVGGAAGSPREVGGAAGLAPKGGARSGGTGGPPRGGGTASALGRFSTAGALAGLAAALCQGLGAVTARQAFLLREAGTAALDPVLAAGVRVVSAAALLWAMALLRGRTRGLLPLLEDRALRQRLVLGTLAGPLLGMLAYIGAFAFAPAGIVSTLTAMTPLLVIPLSAWRYGLRPGPFALLATGVAVFGVGLICL